MKDDSTQLDLLGPLPIHVKEGPRLYVPPAARIIAYAIALIGRAATEAEIIEQCARMRRDGMTDFDLGTSSNLRNRIQRNWAKSTIYQTTYGPQGYAAIFVRIKGAPARWALVQGFNPMTAA